MTQLIEGKTYPARGPHGEPIHVRIVGLDSDPSAGVWCCLAADPDSEVFLQRSAFEPSALTRGQRFIAKAAELMPHQAALREIDPALDRWVDIDDVLFREAEYLGGMAAVIIEILRNEEG